MKPVILAVSAAALLIIGMGAFDAPEATPVSAYAPAEDVAKLINDYAERAAEAVVSEEEFEAKGSRMVRDAHVLVVLGTALGLHDEDHPLKSSAPSIVAAARALASAGEDLAAAQQGVTELQASIAGRGAGSAELNWERVKALGELMKHVNFVNTRLKRNLRRFEQQQAQNAADATLLALIGNVTDYDTHEVKDPAQLPEWHKHSVEMRSAAADLAAQIKLGDKAAAEAAAQRLAKNCDDCHAVFHRQ